MLKTIALAALAWLPLLAAAEPARLVFRCAPGNDLYQALTSAGARFARYDSPDEAVSKAPRGAGVLLLADGYPQQTTPASPELFRKAATKRLRLYIEYPAALRGLEVGEPREVNWERAVVASDVFAPELRKMRILGLHKVRYVPVKAVIHSVISNCVSRPNVLS